MSQQKILVADDDKTTRLILSSMLENESYQVDSADRGEKTLFMALETTYDAILIDLNMPGLGGVDLCKKIRSISRYTMTPIIVVTSMTEEANLAEVLEAGASDFISKPVNQIVLAARLKSHLEKKQFYDDLERSRHYLNRYISSRTQKMVEAYSITGLVPTPELHNVCVMFTDIRGFTQLSTNMNLEALFTMVSDKLGQQIDHVYQNNGYIDKFGGDGLMAIFDGQDATINACLCALQIIATEAETGNDRYPIGIGLHFGPVLIGNIGSNDHLDYSAIGETVNMASRLCANADSMQILVSDEIVQQVNQAHNIQFADTEKISIRGMDKPVQVSSLVGS